MKKKIQKKSTVQVHQTLNYIMTFLLFVFAIWNVYLNIQARALLKESTSIAGQVEDKIETITDNVGKVTELCNNVNSAIDQIHQLATTTKK